MAAKLRAAVDCRSPVTPVLLFILAFLSLGVMVRIAADSMDRNRIRRYVLDRGGAVRDIRWVLFGPGWYGDQNRIYEVGYYDADGNEHAAIVKTSALAGVYFTEDRITRHSKRAAPAPAEPPPPTPRGFPVLPVGQSASPTNDDELAALREENRRLREEIDRLRAARGD